MTLHNLLQRVDDVALKCTPFGFGEGNGCGDKPPVVEPIITAPLLERIERRLVVVVDFHLVVCAPLV